MLDANVISDDTEIQNVHFAYEEITREKEEAVVASM